LAGLLHHREAGGRLATHQTDDVARTINGEVVGASDRHFHGLAGIRIDAAFLAADRLVSARALLVDGLNRLAVSRIRLVERGVELALPPRGIPLKRL
jgi:hypothetical protein